MKSGSSFYFWILFSAPSKTSKLTAYVLIPCMKSLCFIRLTDKKVSHNLDFPTPDCNHSPKASVTILYFTEDVRGAERRFMLQNTNNCKVSTRQALRPLLVTSLLGLKQWSLCPTSCWLHISYWLLSPFFFLSLGLLIIPSSHGSRQVLPRQNRSFCSLGTHDLRALPTITGLSQIKITASPRGTWVPAKVS